MVMDMAAGVPQFPYSTLFRSGAQKVARCGTSGRKGTTQPRVEDALRRRRQLGKIFEEEYVVLNTMNEVFGKSGASPTRGGFWTLTGSRRCTSGYLLPASADAKENDQMR